MGARGSGIVVLLVACVALIAGGGDAALAAPVITVVDGVTAPVFDYQQAIRQRVYIPQLGVDQDGDGNEDRIAIEIMRPKESDAGLKVPVIIDPSPYYTTACRGNENQCIGDVDTDGLNDKWPLYYDNYFVPRGYAYIIAEADGTANSQGCPLHGGPGDITAMKSVIDWLNGRALGVDKNGSVTADWDNGKAAMIGKSYDGTLANGVAATGVAGLTTIVPISAISDWYGYSRMGGIRFNSNYPSSLASTVTDSVHRPACAATRATMDAADGDETGDRNPFWDARDYVAGVGNVKASVFATHGLQDDNVRLGQLSAWWDGLAANDVPRKLWLLRGGHVDPFDSRRAVFVDTLHRWFDHWLLGIDNGIMDEPRVDIEDAKDTWHTYADWPLPGASPTDMFLRGTTQAGAGELGLVSGGATDTLTWTDVGSQSETTMMNNPDTGPQASRRVFLGPVLKQDLRISGTPVVDLRAAVDKPQTNLGALLVDYGAGTQVTRSGDGLTNTTQRTCWGASNTNGIDYSACYLEVSKPTVNVTQWRVTKGILDSSNRGSLSAADPLTVGLQTRLTWPLVPQEHVFAAGHRIGVVLVGNYTSFTSINGTVGATITMNARLSRVTLPIVGGYAAAVAAGAFAPDTVAPALDGVPADVAVADAEPGGAAVSYATPTVTDDEDPAPTVACAPASGSTFPVGSTTVTCTGRDAAGNSAERTFTVVVAGRPVTPSPESPPADPGDGTPPSVPPAGTAIDRVAPVLIMLRLTALRGAARLRFRLSEGATVTVTIRRRGSRQALKTVVQRLGAGERAITVRPKVLRKGRYEVTITARDAAGNRAKLLQRPLTIER